MISAAFPYQKKRKSILGLEMAYVDEGQGDPMVFLHGNPTSSYAWRNILPDVQDFGRVVVPDLIGMGDSQKLPESGPGSYTFVEPPFCTICKKEGSQKEKKEPRKHSSDTLKKTHPSGEYSWLKQTLL
jgi:pimeloyl-ACP methyl ester carboxylesterase